MPIVKDYKCEKCGWILEKWHVENKPQTPPLCPSCMEPTKQMISAPKVILKGLGWGRDGYAKDIDQAELEWYRRGENVDGEAARTARSLGIRQEKSSPEDEKMIKKFKEMQKML